MTQRTDAQILAELNAALVTNANLTTPQLNVLLQDVNDSKLGLDKLPLSNVGTRILNSRMGTFDNSTSQTFQVTAALEQDFDAVRLVLANTLVGSSPWNLAAKASVISSAADLNNSSGTWYQFQKSGANRFGIPIAPAGDRPAYTVSDWLPLKSIARTDGGTKPLVVIRMIVDALATIPVYGNTDDLTNWATKPDGNIWAARNQAGNFVTTTTGFTSTTNVSQSPIYGIQYLARGKVITVMGAGDSITSGRGTYIGEGFVLPACQALTNPASVALQYCNFGWDAQNTTQFTARILDMLDSPIKPDILVIPTGSPNDANTTLTADNIQTMAWNRQAVIAKCKEVGVRPILWTWLPATAATKPYGTSDALRVTENTAVFGLNNKYFPVSDTSTAVSGAISGGQVQLNAAYTADGLHPNDAGNAVLTTVIQPYIKQVAGV